VGLMARKPQAASLRKNQAPDDQGRNMEAKAERRHPTATMRGNPPPATGR
jgi:hypothetical protein